MLTPSLRVKTLQNSLKGLTLQCTCEILHIRALIFLALFFVNAEMKRAQVICNFHLWL